MQVIYNFLKFRSGLKPGHSQSAASNPAFSLVQSIEIAKDGGCRIVASSDMLGMLLVSQPSLNTFFPGSGFRKVVIYSNLFFFIVFKIKIY